MMQNATTHDVEEENAEISMFAPGCIEKVKIGELDDDGYYPVQYISHGGGVYAERTVAQYRVEGALNPDGKTYTIAVQEQS